VSIGFQATLFALGMAGNAKPNPLFPPPPDDAKILSAPEARSTLRPVRAEWQATVAAA
jgi:hypothetical protein